MKLKATINFLKKNRDEVVKNILLHDEGIKNYRSDSENFPDEVDGKLLIFDSKDVTFEEDGNGDVMLGGAEIFESCGVSVLVDDTELEPNVRTYMLSIAGVDIELVTYQF